MIEIVVALAIVAMIFTVSIVGMRGAQGERKFREPVTNIEGFAKKARSLSLIQRRDYQLVFDEFGVTLEPVGDEEDDDEGVLRLFDDGEEEVPERFALVTDRYDLPDDMRLEVKGWNQDWIELKRDRTFVWTFKPEGLVEPVEVRVRSENGYIRQSYNPLTGAMAEEQYEFR